MVESGNFPRHTPYNNQAARTQMHHEMIGFVKNIVIHGNNGIFRGTRVPYELEVDAAYIGQESGPVIIRAQLHERQMYVTVPAVRVRKDLQLLLTVARNEGDIVPFSIVFEINDGQQATVRSDLDGLFANAPMQLVARS